MKPLAIASSELRRFFRDRTALFFSLALPFVLILLIGTATSGFDDQVFEVGIVGGTDGAHARSFRDALDRHERLALRSYHDRDAMAKDVRRAAVPAGLVVPDGYDRDLLAGRTAEVELLIDQTRGAAPASIRSLVAEVATEQGATLQAGRFAAERTGLGVEEAIERARRTADEIAGTRVAVTSRNVGEAEEEGYLAPGIGYQAPSNLVLWVFITSLAGSGLLIQSRQLRVMQRMFASPTPAGTILFGQGLARFAIAAGQALFIFGVGAFVFGVDWGQPIGAAVLIGLFVLVGTSVGLLFGTIFSTPDQAGTIGSMSGIAMGMLGGCMWPLEIVPEPMRIIGHAFPHAWAMDAWIELIGRGGTLADITTELAVLAGFVAVLGPLGIWRLRRALVA